MSMPRSPAAASRLSHAVIAATLLSATAACTPPPDSPTEKPTEPQAAQLRDAVRKPLDAAQKTRQSVDADAQRTREAIEAAGG